MARWSKPCPHGSSAKLWLHFVQREAFLKKVTLLHMCTKNTSNFLTDLDVGVLILLGSHLPYSLQTIVHMSVQVNSHVAVLFPCGSLGLMNPRLIRDHFFFPSMRLVSLIQNKTHLTFETPPCWNLLDRTHLTVLSKWRGLLSHAPDLEKNLHVMIILDTSCLTLHNLELQQGPFGWREGIWKHSLVTWLKSKFTRRLPLEEGCSLTRVQHNCFPQPSI